MSDSFGLEESLSVDSPYLWVSGADRHTCGLQHKTLIPCKLGKMLLTMYKVPHAQYTNYTDEGPEKADDSQSVKCFYPLQAWTDPHHSPYPWPPGQRSTLMESRGIPGTGGIAVATTADSGDAQMWHVPHSRKTGLTFTGQHEKPSFNSEEYSERVHEDDLYGKGQKRCREEFLAQFKHKMELCCIPDNTIVWHHLVAV